MCYTEACQISVGGGEVWVVNSSDKIYRRTGVTANHAGGDWVEVGGALKQVNVSNGRVVGRNAQQKIYHRDTTSNGWEQVPGELTHISNHGSDWYVGVNASMHVYFKKYGGDWVKQGGELVQADVSGDRIWGVTKGQDIYTCGLDFTWTKIDGKLTNISVA